MGIGYGGFMELAQHYFIDGRYGAISDFIANSLGAFAGLVAFKKLNSSESLDSSDNRPSK